MASSNSHLQRGYVPFNGEPGEYPGWVVLTRSLLGEAGLSHVLSGTDTGLELLREDATDAEAAAHGKATTQKFMKEKNWKLYTRLLLATSDGQDGFSSPASQVVQQHGPVRGDKYGNGRSAYKALEKKFFSCRCDAPHLPIAYRWRPRSRNRLFWREARRFLAASTRAHVLWPCSHSNRTFGH